MKSMIKIFSSPSLALLTTGVIIFASCTKADFSDDFKQSSPPPIGNYNTSDDVAKDAIIAKWSFENNFNDSIQNLTGTNHNASFVEGFKGMGYQGNDTSYVTFKQPGSIPNLKGFTISFWMKAPQTNGLARGIWSLNNKTDFWGNLDIYMENFSSPDTAYFKVHLANNIGGVNIGQFTETKIPAAINKWTSIIISYDSATSVFNIYANSQSQPINVGSQSNVRGPVLSGPNNTNYGPLNFKDNNASAVVLGTWQFQPNDPEITSTGSQPWAGGFAGILDEFRIYSRALTAKEVDALFRLEKLGL